MTNSEITILLVDDEQDIHEFIGYNIRKEGYGFLSAFNGSEAIRIAKEKRPQLILMDIMLPGIDGVEACREIRQNPELKNTIIAFLTARGEDYSQIAGFEAGGDDYITKPIGPRVLMSRIKALLRRITETPEEEEDQLIIAGDIKIDRKKHIVWNKNEPIQLTKKEFNLLALLTAKPGRVFTREEIFKTIWKKDIMVGERTMDVHVRRIREAGISAIVTIKGVGYKFQS
jgi:two-component system, OmpR family, alkaline phosphatase synthesis response regulator PhoP